MIKQVTAKNAKAHTALLNEMFRARKALFADRLGWPVTVDEQGREMDRYDARGPHYLIATDDKGQHRGSLRLLPMVGETMLRDYFTEVFDGTIIESPLIWECTRFCVEGERDALPAITSELLLGLCEVGLKQGIVQIGGVFDEQTMTICRHLGWSPVVLGKRGRGKKASFLTMWEINEDSAETLRTRSQISGPVLEAV